MDDNLKMIKSTGINSRSEQSRDCPLFLIGSFFPRRSSGSPGSVISCFFLRLFLPAQPPAPDSPWKAPRRTRYSIDCRPGFILSVQRSSLFRRIPLFAGLSEPELEALSARAAEKKFLQGEALFREGEPSAGIFLLAEGTVKIFKTSPSGREIMLSMDTAPASVAEVPIFDGGPYPATVSAVSEVTAYLVSKQDFQHVCRTNPEVALKVLAAVGQRLRRLVHVVESVTFGSVRQRLARTLL